MYYYAKLNENQICTEVISRGRELPKDLDGFIKIPDYNETLLWRKWDGDQWSQERYEPSIEAELQERIKELGEENERLIQQIQHLLQEREEDKKQLQQQNQAIADLTVMISTLQTPAK